MRPASLLWSKLNRAGVQHHDSRTPLLGHVEGTPARPCRAPIGVRPLTFVLAGLLLEVSIRCPVEVPGGRRHPAVDRTACTYPFHGAEGRCYRGSSTRHRMPRLVSVSAAPSAIPYPPRSCALPVTLGSSLRRFTTSLARTLSGCSTFIQGSLGSKPSRGR